MSTGDLKNNLKKLQAEVKSIKYPEPLDVAGLTHGVPSAYLSIYNYAFTQYSHSVAELISGMDVELFGKSDLRFIESIYKVLRDLFSYKPPVTKDQFFSNGFKERKVIMCAEILNLIKTKHRELNPKEHQTNRGSSASALSSMKGYSRPKTATVELNVGVDSKTDADSKNRKIAPSRPKPLTGPPARKTTLIHAILPNAQNTPAHLSAMSSSSSQSSSSSSSSSSCPVPQFKDNASVSSSVQFASSNPVVNEYTPDKHQVEHPVSETWIKTPSISKVCARSVEIVTIPRNEKDHLSFDDSTSVDTFVSSTPDKHRKSDEVPEYQSLQLQITNLYESMNKVINRVNDMTNKIQTLNDDLTRNQQVQDQSEFNNLKARLLLVENRVAMLESQAAVNHVQRQFTMPSQNGMNEQKEERHYIASTGDNYSEGNLPETNNPTAKLHDNFVKEYADNHDIHSPVIEECSNNKTDSSAPVLVKPVEKSSRTVSQKCSKAILKKLVDSHSDFCDESAEFPSPIRQVEGKSEHYNESDASYLNLRVTSSDPRRTSTPNDISNPNGEASFHFTDKDMQEKVDRLRYMLKDTEGMLKSAAITSQETQKE